MKIKCAIVDDEPVAARGIEGYARQVDTLKVVGVFPSALELNKYMSENELDLVFLDIEMPYLTGIDWLKSVRNPPKIIFTTAYNKYALEGFELDVVDYLLKPISFARFLKAVNKMADRMQEKGEDDFIFIKSEGKLVKILLEDIVYVQALQNYVTFHTTQGSLIAHLTMKAVNQQLPTTQFIQIHKSYVISLNHVQAIEGNQVVMKPQTRVPLGTKSRDTIIEKITQHKVIRR